jgi:hypothetical protein
MGDSYIFQQFVALVTFGGTHISLLGMYVIILTLISIEWESQMHERELNKVSIRQISSLQLKRSFRKGCQIFVVDMEETPKDKVPRIEEYAFLK